ncbi:MAG TPA: hemerythrin domain-containing protein [Casimicrobiaceae bacterium]
MQHAAVRIIRDEHLAIASVLYGLRSHARRMRGGAEPPDLPLLHAMLDYIVEYPDRWHHPKESRYLFAALRERNAEAGGLIDELEREHRDGERHVAGLMRALTSFERGERAAMHAFADAVEAYADMQWEHMRKEEDVLLPLAERSLDAGDWQRIAAAFQENDNPLFGIKPKDDAARLYQRILAMTAR